MAVASFILGIFAFIISFIPIVGFISFIPALLGIVFGIVAIARKRKESKAMQIVGLIFSTLAILVSFVWIGLCFYMGEMFQNTSFTEIDTEIIGRKETYTLQEDIRFFDRVLKVEKIEKNEGTEEVKPKEGYEFLNVTVSIKNIAEYEIEYGPLDFRIKDQTGRIYESDYIRIHSLTALKASKLPKGEVITSFITFEIPKDTKSLTLEYLDYENEASIFLDEKDITL